MGRSDYEMRKAGEAFYDPDLREIIHTKEVQWGHGCMWCVYAYADTCARKRALIGACSPNLRADSKEVIFTYWEGETKSVLPEI